MGDSAPVCTGRGSPAPGEETDTPSYQPPGAHTPLVAPRHGGGERGQADALLQCEEDLVQQQRDELSSSCTMLEDLPGVHQPQVAANVAVSTMCGGASSSDSDSDMDFSTVDTAPRRPRVRHPAANGRFHRKYIPPPGEDIDDVSSILTDISCKDPMSPTARTPLVATIEGRDIAPPEVVAASLPLAPPSIVTSMADTAGYPVAGYLETPGLPILLAPLSGKSDSCSYIMPPTAACSSGALDSKSDTNSLYLPLCRICHMSDEDEPLISPCRCSGTLQHIHNTCLMRWLEILSKKSRKPPRCELCHFQYHRHKKFKFHHWRFPRVSRQDKILHVIFLINLVMMIGCAVATVMSFLSDEGSLNHTPPGNNVELSTEEIITLSCGVLFFVSFFIAMSVQIKAKHTIYQLLVKFIMHNMEWEIDEYDKSKDTLYKDLYKGLPVYV